MLITKRFLSQLYGRPGGGGETVAGLERKVELCNQLLSLAAILDPGHSQFRGLTLFDLFLGRLGLAQAAEGTSEMAALSSAAKGVLHPLLEDCLACLRIESPLSHAGRVATKAAAYLDQLRADSDKCSS